MNSLRRRIMISKVAAGIDYVDLGLPSGLLWATCNIGADSPEKDGLYFSFANVVGHTADEGYVFDSTTYNNTTGKNAYLEISLNDATYNAAFVNLGSPWTIPLNNDFTELNTNTDHEEVTVNGVVCCKFMKKTDHNIYILIPYSGYIDDTTLDLHGEQGFYWSASRCTTSGKAYYCQIDSSGATIPNWYGNRYSGLPIRPVRYPDMEYVDLGLPSGIKWATCNLGASQPTDAGLYFSWGNVIGHRQGEGYNFNQTDYNSTPGKSLTADIAVGGTYDAACACLGTPWRLPTNVEFKELYDNTDSEWVSNYNSTGVAGRKFMKKSDHSVYIFFSACGLYNGTSLYNEGTNGYYWSSTYNSSSNAYYLGFYSSGVLSNYYNNRYYGFSVRAVFDPSL